MTITRTLRTPFALALLAAWCIGRPYGVAPLSLIGGSIALGAQMLVEFQAGEALNDITGVAFVLAAAALLVNGYETKRAGAPVSRIHAGALVVAGDGRWPHARFRLVAVVAVLGGLAYTVFSEWLNTEIRGSWAYTELMPQLPLIGSGVSPLAQWIFVPLAAFWWARRPFPARQRPKESSL